MVTGCWVSRVTGEELEQPLAGTREGGGVVSMRFGEENVR